MPSMLRQTPHHTANGDPVQSALQSLPKLTVKCPPQTSRSRILRSARSGGLAALLRVACRRVSPAPEPTGPQTWCPQPYPIFSCPALKGIFPLSGNIIFHLVLCSTLLSSIAALFSFTKVTAASDLFITGSLTKDCSTQRRAWLTVADSSRLRMSVIALGSTSRTNNNNGTVTESLEIALSEFGSVLTDDERKQLQQVKGVPDASAALIFTFPAGCIEFDSTGKKHRRSSLFHAAVNLAILCDR